MKEFERNEAALIRRHARDLINDSKIGEITNVYEHKESDDNSNFEVDVAIDGRGRNASTNAVETRITPVMGISSGQIAVPKVGDKVVVTFLDGADARPVITGIAYTTSDRAPVGLAGMTRDKYESGDSPAGSGDLYFTGYTRYDDDVAISNKSDATPEDVFLQWIKRPEDEADPTLETNTPAKVEFYDSPLNDEAHIVVELNRKDGVDSNATWGLKFDLKTGEFKILDPEGYGIVSDGAGNFTWHYDSIDFSEDTTTSL